jgi:hypothetical protein
MFGHVRAFVTFGVRSYAQALTGLHQAIEVTLESVKHQNEARCVNGVKVITDLAGRPRLHSFSFVSIK